MDTGKQRADDTKWRLVAAKCAQLADAVTSARVPFLLLLTWSFAWLWALYSVGFGYTTIYFDRLAKLKAVSELPEFEQICTAISPLSREDEIRVAGRIFKIEPAKKLEYCRGLVTERYTFASNSYLQSMYTSLPGGMGRLHISDLGVMGNLGTLLLLSWTYFALRRENHAIKTFVDLSPADQKTGRAFPSRFLLVPRDEYFSAEHYAFAYQSVSQRFMFILSSHSRPLLSLTIGLMAAPAIVSALNFVDDTADIFRTPYLFEPIVWVRYAFEAVLVSIVIFGTLKIILTSINSSLLLNGWHLAVRDVWLDAWDERNDDQASPVLIDATRQIAHAATNLDTRP